MDFMTNNSNSSSSSSNNPGILTGFMESIFRNLSISCQGRAYKPVADLECGYVSDIDDMDNMDNIDNMRCDKPCDPSFLMFASANVQSQLQSRPFSWFSDVMLPLPLPVPAPMPMLHQLPATPNSGIQIRVDPCFAPQKSEHMQYVHSHSRRANMATFAMLEGVGGGGSIGRSSNIPVNRRLF